MKITNFLFSNYEKDLLANVTPANNLTNQISNSLLIHARGLSKYFPELLSGQNDWVKKFKENKFYNEPRAINKDEYSAYQTIIKNINGKKKLKDFKMKFEADFINRFQPIIEEYKLNYKVISEEELALFGSNFALVFFDSF